MRTMRTGFGAYFVQPDAGFFQVIAYKDFSQSFVHLFLVVSQRTVKIAPGIYFGNHKRPSLTPQKGGELFTLR